MNLSLATALLLFVAPLSTIAGTSDSAEAINTAAIERPYEDPLQQSIPSGIRSFYLAPWRAYLDTWPVKQFLDCLGINFNVPAADAAATAQVLAEAGFRSARIELGWGSLGYDDPLKIRNAKQYAEVLRALHAAGIRPLIVLNANSGAPVPYKYLHAVLSKPAVKGARELFLESAAGIRPGYSGLAFVVPQKLAFPLVSAVDPTTGRCELSAPLPCDLAAGPIILADLKYHPFSSQMLADGTPNPWSQETVDGWKTYVHTVCQIVKAELGTEGKSDAGFDLEVWNEFTFGSDFLDEANYYEPRRVFKPGAEYKNHGLVAIGREIILPITVDYVSDPANRLPGVRVISGFSNQRPWETGATLWPGQAGFSRHFYTALNPSAPYHAFWGLISPATNSKPDHATIDALAHFDGMRNGHDWYGVTPGSYFVPTLSVSMPEAIHYGYTPEYVARDIQPFPSLWVEHYRFSNAGDGHPAQVWMTETNTGRSAWLQSLSKELQLPIDDSRLVTLSHHLGAKALLRMFVFDSHKGVHTIEAFAAREKDWQLAVIPEAFFATLKKENHLLTDAVRGQTGEQLAVMSRVNRLMQEGEDLQVTRPLTISRIGEHEPRLVFKGDGTPAHPDRFNRDDFACLPFQFNANRFVLAYYVVTENMVEDQRPELGLLDPARYEMPPQTFDVTVANINGDQAKVSAWDPFSDSSIPVKILSSTNTTLSVRLETVDYPRFLIIEETEPGPLILDPKVSSTPEGGARVSFQTNLPVTATLSWGSWPQRTNGGTATLPAGKDFTYVIPQLAVHEGVHVEIDRDGLVVPWPRWPYDVAGVVWPKKAESAQNVDPADPPSARLPGLQVSHLPTGYESLLPAGLVWKEHGGAKTASIGSGQLTAQVTLSLLAPDNRKPANLLPFVSALDECRVTTLTLNGVEGWRADIQLDARAQLDHQNLYNVVYIFPTRPGWLKLTCEGSKAAVSANSGTLQQILANIRFSF